MVKAETFGNVSSGLFDLDFSKAVDLSSITSTSNDVDHFKQAVETNKQLESVSYYEIVLPSGLNMSPITRQVYVAGSDGIVLMEARSPVTQDNKETLANLLDFAADSDCEMVIACVQKNDPNFKSIVASFMSVGFSIARNMSFGGYVLLGNQL